MMVQGRDYAKFDEELFMERSTVYVKCIAIDANPPVSLTWEAENDLDNSKNIQVVNYTIYQGNFRKTFNTISTAIFTPLRPQGNISCSSSCQTRFKGQQLSLMYQTFGKYPTLSDVS